MKSAIAVYLPDGSGGRIAAETCFQNSGYDLLMPSKNWLVFIVLLAVPSVTGFQPYGRRLLVCEVLDHPEQYTGKGVTIRGVYVHYEHGTYLLPSPTCRKDSELVIHVLSSDEVSAAIRDFLHRHGVQNLKGVRIVATLEGRLESVTYRKNPGLLFSVGSISGMALASRQ
jgi:hypothetical protein